MPESSTTNVGESPYGKRPQRPGPKPGTRLANGKRVPPPPAPKGTIILKRKESNSAEPINESLRLFDAEIKLGTRPACEKAIERIVNWIKAGKVNANDGNAMLLASLGILVTVTPEMWGLAVRGLLAGLERKSWWMPRKAATETATFRNCAASHAASSKSHSPRVDASFLASRCSSSFLRQLSRGGSTVTTTTSFGGSLLLAPAMASPPCVNVLLDVADDIAHLAPQN